MKSGHVAVIDIGKTNAKLVLVNLADLSEIDVITQANTVINAEPWPHFDTEGIWDFLLAGLKAFQTQHGIDAISITTHGACAALLSDDGTLAAPILDYEYIGPEETETAEEYDRIRPTFGETGSPRLAGGLNIGAQLHWQFSINPALRGRTQHIVTYPQYWAFRLTGIAATDITSLGCHSDLWNPSERCYSSLVDRLGIRDKMAPVRKPNDVLGQLLPDIAKQTSLAESTPIVCGIHDSNASLLPHILQNKPPFSVVSTGTWVIAMSIGGKPIELDPDKDTLINVNALGDPVPSARFMGGREYELAIEQPYAEPTEEILENVLKDKIMLLPAVIPDTGPFQGRKAHWRNNMEPQPGTAQRGAATALYLALVTTHCLELIGRVGPIIVEGPFTNNRVYLKMLAEITQTTVWSTVGMTGTSQGGALLVSKFEQKPAGNVEIKPTNDALGELMREFAAEWRTLI